jgi:urease accessory protein
MIIPTHIIMTDMAALYRLIAWTSPSFPTGAFSYSHGLEWAVEAGSVSTEEDVLAWIEHALSCGVGRVDGAMLAAAYRAGGDPGRLSDLIDLASAWRATAETALEALQPGAAFLSTVRAAWPSPILDRFAMLCGDRKPGLALCFGVAAAITAPLDLALQCYLGAFAAHQVSAGVRLVPLGQTAGQRVIAALEPAVAGAALRAEKDDIDRIGTTSWAMDIASMRHETQTTRLFRS